MSELFSIQLQNRQQQGRDGIWLDLPTTTEQVQAALRQIGISSDNPQGLFISGYFAEEEKRFAIPYNMVLASNVDELNFLASRLETLSTGERAELNAALQAPQSELFSIGRITDFPENVDYYVHLPDVHGPAQLGDYYLNRSGMVDMPEEWKGGIDTAQFGRYVAQQEQGAFTQYGYLVKSGDEWQKVHEGQPVPEEYRVLSFPAPEVLRDAANIPPPVQPETEPQKVIPIILNGKDSVERMKEITDRLETGIQELFDSDRYKAYLTTMAKFHNYSFNNTLLIAMQGGQLVAGFNKWKDTFHRTVKKGEKGIKILAPAPYKVKQKMEKLDEQGNLSAMEQTATAALREGQNISPEQAAYYNAVVAYVQDCRPLLNQGQYNLPEPPKLADFDQSLQDYKAQVQVQAEIAQEAAAAGMTVEEYAAAGFEAPQQGSFSIYQLRNEDSTRDYRFEPYDRLQAAGRTVDKANYTEVYAAPLAAGTTLEDIYRTFNVDHPADFKGHSLSVSDVVVLHQNGQDTAHYCDSVGFQQVPEFLRENPLRAAELSTEQNENMIDGVLNNAPSLGVLEAKAKAGEQISLTDIAAAVKAEEKTPKAKKSRTAKPKKPSIRAQLDVAKKEQSKQTPPREKTRELEV